MDKVWCPVSDAIREDEALATDVDETSEAEVRGVSGDNGPDEAETNIQESSNWKALVATLRDLILEIADISEIVTAD